MSPVVSRLTERLRDLARLMRIEDYGTFSQMVVGFLLGGGRDLGYLGVTLLILAPGLYGGLYALNDAHDYQADRLHPAKRSRPVAAGRLSPRAAAALGVSLIAVALAAAALYDRQVFGLALLFLALNLLYTFRLKTVPYVEIVLNAVTHPLRFVGGLWLAGSVEHGLVVAAGCLAVLALTTLKRIKEMREAELAARPVLRHYTEAALKLVIAVCLVGLAALWPWATGWDQALVIVWLVVAAGTVIGYFRVPAIRRLTEHLWR